MTRGQEAEASPTRVYRVDDLVLDLGRQQLSRDNEILRLPGLSFDLLAALVRAAPDVLTLDQIMDQVWGRVVVSPETVSQRVKLLRDALGDDPRRPRYIAVVRGRGYRLLAPVEPLLRDPFPARSESAARRRDDPAEVNDQTKRGRLRIPLSALGVVVAVAFATIVLRERAPTAAPSLPTTDDTRSAARDSTVAILPFQILGNAGVAGDPATALAEAILNRLASIPGINVIARRSSFAAAESGVTPEEIGRRLGARYLLDGSVQSDAQRLRVTASLADADTGRQLWSIAADRPVSEWLEIQDDISLRVVRSMASTLPSPVATRLPTPHTLVPAARLLYLQASALAASERMVDLDAAVAGYTEALALDPAMADAYAGMADAYLMLADIKGEVLKLTEPRFMNAAEDAIARALALDPENGAAIIARAQIHAHHRRLDEAAADFRTGIMLEPNDAAGYGKFARFLFYSLDPFENPDSTQAQALRRKRYEEALLMIGRASQLDPLSARHGFLRGQMLLHLGRLDEAESAMFEALRLDPDYYPALGRLAQIHWLTGEVAEAIRLAEQALRLEPRALWIRHYLIHFYVDVGETDAAEEVLRQGGNETASAGMVLRLRQGQVADAAGTALRIEGQPLPWDRDIAAFALRELLTIEPRRREDVVRALESRIRRIPDQQQPTIHHGSRFAALELAQIKSASTGTASAGRSLASDVLESVARDVAIKEGSSAPVPFRADLRQKALALALLGEPAQAVQTLREVTSGRTMRHLWYDLERQPAFDDVRASPDFEAIRDDYRTWVTVERTRLARLRNQGIVPVRGAAG